MVQTLDAEDDVVVELELLETIHPVEVVDLDDVLVAQ